MTLKLNIIANTFSQLYVALVGLLILPVFIKILGQEPYGLIALFTTIQGIFTILDFGLSPTLSREAARFRVKNEYEGAFAGLFLFVKTIFLAFFIAILVLSLTKYTYVSEQWLKTNSLSKIDVNISIQLMLIAAAVRLFSSPYRSLLSGDEKFIWLSKLNFWVTTARFIFVIPVLLLVSNDIKIFFVYQLGVVILEFFVIKFKAESSFPFISKSRYGVIKENFSYIKNSIKFSLIVAVSAAVWTLFSQLDKLFVSNVVSLSTFGHYSLAATAASIVIILNSPFGAALMPRLASLYASGNKIEFEKTFCQSSSISIAVTFSVVATQCLWAQDLLNIWIQDEYIVNEICIPFILLSFGNLFVVINSQFYYFLYAKGKLRMHLVGTSLLLLGYILSLFLVSTNELLITVSGIWCLINFVYVFYMLSCFYATDKELFKKWLLSALLKPLLLPFILFLIVFNSLEGLTTANNYTSLAYTLLTFLVFLFISSGLVRKKLGLKF